MPRLSVIVTSYNIEDYLEECLDSIVGQTLTDLEIIVVDDGSSDSSPDIVARYAERDPRVVPVLLPDNSLGGVATAANAGLDRATGDYVGFADGDDRYEPDMFARLLAAAEDADSDLAMCQYVLLDDEDGSVGDPADVDRWDEVIGDVHRLDVSTRRQFLRFIAVPWRKIYRRSMLEDNDLRFPVGDYFYEDNPFHWFAVLSADSIALVRAVLCQHRVARLGQTMGTVDERLFRIFAHHDTILAWLEERGVDREYRATLLAWAISQMEWISRRTPPELRRELFDVLSGVYAHHDAETVHAALATGSKGRRAVLLSEAITADNFATFNRVLDEGPTGGGLLTAVQYHLRYSGVRETSRVTARFALLRTRRVARAVKRRTVQALQRIGRSAGPGDDVTRSDLMFALMVVEHRLEEIEGQLRRLDHAPDEDD